MLFKDPVSDGIRWAWLILSEAHEGLVKAKTEEIEAGKKQLEVWWVLVSKIQASNSWKDGVWRKVCRSLMQCYNDPFM